PNLAFSVQTRVLADLPYKPFDVNNALAAAIQTATSSPLNVRAPQQILSVVCAVPSPATAFLGLSRTADNLSDWAGGVRRFARETDQVSRSEFKLLEALEIFAIALPSHGMALDLGAAPGGWTRVLRQRQQYVTAIDPGELDPRLAQDRDVRHKRMTAEAYLNAEPDSFDIIVNDMRMDARDSARLMVAYRRQLYPTGIVIMTLKLPEQKRRPVIDHAFTILREAYAIVGARQLFHNRSEITVYLKLSAHQAS
ncbi:MAG: 50S rRNA methyltransferase, partial [Chloroflexota bacterium]|nr:50S rRNA methyltransferase [Chloroflexota bacterium]